ncbi:AlpA family transcriptional regulator [Dysgonomonas sp. ZJ709]|uniref:helix-turn-helix transcriptional regulator n=1 Tax=Dysgonomonas sp. ZJ709 TaxID=2709797 RepID=UPI0013EA282F|nr:hypothetical protein [Dysgonomonas sp. ZJ709]
MESQRNIGFEDEAFKTIMNKLERVDDFVRQVAPLIKEYHDIKKCSLAEKRFISSKEAAKVLGISRRTLDRYKKAKKVFHYVQLGGRAQYDYNELVSYRYNQRHPNTKTGFMSKICTSIANKKKKK